MKIPFAPPFIDDDVKNEVLSALESGWITTGPRVKALELETAKYAGIDHVLCVNSATSGLMLVLHWLGIGRGDEPISSITRFGGASGDKTSTFLPIGRFLTSKKRIIQRRGRMMNYQEFDFHHKDYCKWSEFTKDTHTGYMITVSTDNKLHIIDNF